MLIRIEHERGHVVIMDSTVTADATIADLVDMFKQALMGMGYGPIAVDEWMGKDK